MLAVFDNLCILFAKAEQKHFQHTKEVLASEGLTVTPVQMMALYALYKGDDITLSELSKNSFLDRATLTGVVDRLEAMGLVRRLDSPEDRRAYKIVLTAKARDLAEPIARVTAQVQADMLAGCSQADVNNFRQILLRIFGNL
jgi:DNA-binding MarR family transcriptional regulator